MAGATGGDGAGFGGHLADSARSVLADARHALADAALSDAERVHELRKAFKRWRALLRLLAAPIGEPAEAMRREARELMRSLSGARDAQGALDAVDDLMHGETGLSPRTQQSIRTRLVALRDAAESACLTPEAHTAIARHLDRASETLASWPLGEVDFDAVADAVAVTYRRARQLTPDDWQDTDAVHLHELRRRVVEHRHQMDLIEPLWPRVTKAWAEEAQRLRNQLGACQDLSVLTTFIGPHRPLAPWRSRLMPLIAARRAAHLRSASRLAGRLFAEKPKAFRKRIGALWTARKRRKTATKPA
jgi:CHAD domain-containing protein